MAGIYLHIPFCKGKCAYCDFYSVATSKYQDDFVKALGKEIQLQKDYLQNESIQTIYFGGGTPSLLRADQLDYLLSEIRQNFKVEESNEITLEANPDDLTEDYLKAIRQIGFNRLSIGVQSFNEQDLKRMKRKHTVNQAIASIKYAKEEAFKNISIDLIYGLTDLKIKDLEINIDKAINLNIQQISAYHLNIEPKTLFYKYYQNDKLNLPTENESLDQFKMLIAKTKEKGFLQYEISNFALDGSLSLHNTNYWMGVKYLGLGPSAHSYNLTSRQWNIQNLRGYLDEILKGKIPYEQEILTKKEKFNEFLITSLRTMWGLNTEKLKRKFGAAYYDFFMAKTKRYLNKRLMTHFRDKYILTEKGMFISDNIMQDFFHD